MQLKIVREGPNFIARRAIKKVQNDCSPIVNDIFQTDFDEVCYQGPNR